MLAELSASSVDVAAVSHYFCHRGDMSTLTLIDDGFYTPKLLRPSVFSRVFLKLLGQMWHFHGPAVPQSRAAAATECFPTAE